MRDDDTSHGGTDGSANDGRSDENNNEDADVDDRLPDGGHVTADSASDVAQPRGSPTRDRRSWGETHPMPWAGLDYGSVDRVDELESTYPDRDVPSLADEATTARTGWDPSDLPRAKRKHWQWLQNLNDGVGEQDRPQQKREADLSRDLDAFAAQLNATDHQQERARWLLDHTELGSIAPRHGITVAVLAALSLAMDEDRTRAARGTEVPGDEQVTSVLREDAFAEMLDGLDADRRAVRGARKRLRETDVYDSPNREEST